MNLNEQLRQAYEDGRRQGLNEQFGGGGLPVSYWIRFITWLLSQGLITNEQYLVFFDQIVSGMSDLEVLISKFGQYIKQFDNPLPDLESPGGGGPVIPLGGDGSVILPGPGRPDGGGVPGDAGWML
jgi:hypothetical protein